MPVACFLVKEIRRGKAAHHWRRLDTGEMFGQRWLYDGLYAVLKSPSGPTSNDRAGIALTMRA